MLFEVNGLTVGYSEASPVIRDISFSLEAGDICCILGHNGVGKSTLFKSLLRLIPPLKGTVRINGEDISSWSPSRLAGSIAYVAQDTQASFPYLTEEIIMLGRSNKLGPFGRPKNDDFDAVNALMKDLGIEKLRGKPYTSISGGERQLVMIARALAQEPSILVLDEPTASLDYGNKVAVMECIRSLSTRNVATIFTTHDPEQGLLLDAKTLMLIPGSPPLFGSAAETITERNLQDAYNASIRVVEIVSTDGVPVRMCIPALRKL